jgi:hypothetical protein
LSIFELFSKNLPPELSDLLDRPVEEATKMAKLLGLLVRLAEVDGEPYSVHSSYRRDRVNFKVEGGRVVEIGVG